MGLKGFNLLKKQAAPPTAWEKIYTWVLGTARVVVVIVELLVVIAFVIRVVIDTQGSRLDKKIKNREAILGGFAEGETNYRNIQNRTTNYQNIWKKSSNYYPALRELDSLLRSNFANLNINVTDEVVTVRGEGDIDQISSFENALKSSTYFTQVETFELNTTNIGDRRGRVGIRAVIKNYKARDMTIVDSTSDTDTDTNLDTNTESQ